MSAAKQTNLDLDALRAEIDAVDQTLVKLLNKRTEIALRIGRMKADHKQAVLDADRERQVYKRVQSENKGPLSSHDLHQIYKNLMSVSKSVQSRLRTSDPVTDACPFSSIGILGMGLMGGSFYLSLKEKWPTASFHVYDPKPCKSYPTSELSEVLDAELIVLGMPVPAICEFITRHGPGLKSGQMVLDLGSTKQSILEQAKVHFASGVIFVGGHPLVGSEKTGFESATPDMFEGAYFTLTPFAAQRAHFKKIEALITGIGANIITVDAPSHDEALALSSHLPHLLALAIAEVASKHVGGRLPLALFTTRSFMSLVRHAAASKDVWQGIFDNNRTSIVSQLDQLMAELGRLRSELAKPNMNLSGWFASGLSLWKQLKELKTEEHEVKNDRIHEGKPHRRTAS